MEYYVVFVTVQSEKEAGNIASVIVKENYARCANIVKGVRSVYQWEGKIEDDSEVLMIIKTTKGAFPALAEKIKELHSYDVPEIIAMPVIDGSKDYLDWLDGD